MANGSETYTAVLSAIRDRLNAIDERQETQDRRLTEEMAGVRKDMTDLRNVVNHQQTVAASNYSKQVAICGGRFTGLEDFKKGVMTIKAALMWSVATAIAASGVAASVAATLVKVLGG